MKTIVWMIGVMFVVLTLKSSAQSPTKIRFSSSLQVGILHGASTSDFQVHAVNGIRYKTLSAGIGIGLDLYYLRSVPFYVDIKKNILNRQKTPFVYGRLGVNFPWVKQEEKNIWMEKQYHNGIYGAIGIGYQLPVTKKIGVNFCIGLDRKELHESITYFNFNGIPPEGRVKTSSEKFTYGFNRISVTTGVSFR